MKAQISLVVFLVAAALAAGCDEKKASEGAAPSATTVASAAPSAAPPVSAAASATAAPTASAASATPVPTPEQYEQKAAAIQPTAADVELSKIEKEIGP